MRLGVATAARAFAHRVPGLGRFVSPPHSGPRRLRELLEALGGVFIKLGQILALQPDVVSREYCDELFDLMDRIPPFGSAAVSRIVQAELGQSVDEIFDEFEQTPFASASIAQVHIARLGERKLAVKVQRPGAHREFGGDIALMRWAVRWIRRLRVERLDWLAHLLEEFTAWTGEELDFRVEARFMNELAAESKGREIARVPKVEWALTTRRVLTSEFLEGTTLLKYLRSLDEGDFTVPDELDALGFEPESFAENALENFFHDVFHRGVFHADLHPANLLILPDNTVGYVDFGISGVVSEHGRRHLVASILALTRGNAGQACEEVLAICEPGREADASGFRGAFEAAGEEWFRRDPSGGRPERRSSYSEILTEILRMSRTFKLLPHAEAIRYMRSVITLDGLIDRFAPDLDRDRLLERESARLLESSVLSTPLSFDRWLDWLSVATQLLREGPARLDRALDLAERRLAVRPDASPQRWDGTPGRGIRALHLAAIAAVMALLILLPGERPSLGWNLVTAELAIIGGALGLLARELLHRRFSPR